MPDFQLNILLIGFGIFVIICTISLAVIKERKHKNMESEYQRITVEKVPITISQTFSKHLTLTKDVNENDIVHCFYREHWDIKSLLHVLKDYVRRDLENPFTHRTTRQLEALFKACEDWTEDEFEIIKE